MRKRVLGLLITILLVIASIQFISSASCDIVERSACGGGKYVVMGVSDLTNAHGEFPDSGIDGYLYVLCCDFQQVRGTICVDEDANGISDNKIIGLSSSTNAHGESPEQTNYLTEVCYDDLECVRINIIDSSCIDATDNDYPLSVLSLSNYTNAHIGQTGDYPLYQICCMTSALQHELCDLTDAFWEYEKVFEGTNVGLIVQGTDCGGVRIKFEVWKKGLLGIWVKIDENPGDTSFSGDTATGYWEPGQTGTFYFKAIVIEDTSKTIDSKDNPLLIVDERESDHCGEIALCSDYNLIPDCNEDYCGGVAENSAPEDVDCDYFNCTCSWNTATEKCEFWVSFEGGGNGGLGGGTCEYKQETTDDCADEYLTYNFIANWTGLPADKPSWCKDSTQTIKCPMRAQLPFFSTSNILIAIALIVLIYIILTRKKSSRKKRK